MPDNLNNWLGDVAHLPSCCPSACSASVGWVKLNTNRTEEVQPSRVAVQGVPLAADDNVSMRPAWALSHLLRA